MAIKRQENRECSFSEVGRGMIFAWGDQLMMKIEPYDGCNAINLDDTSLYMLDDEDRVDVLPPGSPLTVS